MNRNVLAGNSFNKTVFLAFYCFLLVTSCANQADKEVTETPEQALPAQVFPMPDLNYIIKPLEGWGMFDTVIQELNVRLILSPASLAEDNPAGNIFVSKMDTSDLEIVTQRNMDYLKNNSSNVELLQRGNIGAGTINAAWFTYTREQNGIKRDLINYIIPANGFAYCVTFGSNKGSIHKYRDGFDKMVKSFRLPSLEKNDDLANTNKADTSSDYMPTGFYFLSEKGDFIRMRKENSDERYSISRQPFASVKNITDSRLVRTRMNGEIYTELYMKFDPKGTKDLAEGTGNPSQPRLAVVIANKLLYVVDNHSKITTGIMNIGLSGYTEEEMEAMRNAIDHKR